MTDNDKCCPPPKEVQDFLFKQASIGQICDEFPSIPVGSSLIAADAKRGLLYVGHENKLIVIRPGIDSNPEWKLELDLPDKVCRVGLSCDCSLLAVTFSRPSTIIYDASSIHKHKLDILHEIRLSTSGGDVTVFDLKWNPAIPEMLCSITSDYTIGCFQVSRDKNTGVQIIGMERAQGLEALCVSWSPKGKQLVIGCKNGDIVQLKPELKLARHLSAPNPSEGIIISILWISNYQFCACYFHSGEQRISVMIVNAPKGVTVPRFTNYEDITFGSGSTDGLCYYFEYIAEWGIIIAASSHSSEVAVLGTSDNGTTWNLWQLMDGSTGQLPLNRKKKTENYPVGVTVDKSPTQKLPWGTEDTLPNPVPILRILVTSGQLCCYHLINLKQNAPGICSPPTEIIPAPSIPRPSLGPSEVSFNLPTGATSTPRSKQIVPDMHADRPKLTTHMFGDTSSSSFTFLAPGNRGTPEITPQTEIKSVGFPAPTDLGKTTGLFGQGDAKINLFPQANKPAFMPQPDQQNKQSTPIIQQPSIQPEIKIPEYPKPDNRAELKIAVAPASAPPAELKIPKEPVAKEPAPQSQQEEAKSTPKITMYDDGICLRAYYGEQARFEKELRGRLDMPSWNCGTEDERQQLVNKSDEIDEFLRELKETTNSLATDIAYLKALLLQSFAWVEETKSKNSSNFIVPGRNRAEGSKLADLQRLYYYTQSQLIQATKVLDLEWAEHKSREMSKMKIPSLEVIYQTLIRYNQIIGQEKKTLEELTKKWRSITRGGGSSSNSSLGSGLSGLDRSMASLNLSQSTAALNDTAIDLRCKLIASNTRNFSRDKQMKLRDLLSESAPRIIRAVRPTAVQDRLEATLSSLASHKANEAAAAAGKTTLRANKSATEMQKIDAPKSPQQVTMDAARSKQQTPLSSLDNLVSGIGGGMSALSKSPSSATPFSTFGTKPGAVTTPSTKSKENVAMPFGQNVLSQMLQATPGMGKPFGKMDTISFGSPAQKLPESQATQENSVAPALGNEQASAVAAVNKFSMFPSNTFGKLSAPEGQSTGGAAATSISTVPKSTFSFSSSMTPSTSPPSFASVPKLDNTSVFKFSTKPSGQQPPAPAQGLDLSSLSFGSRVGLTVTPVSTPATSSSGLTFGNPSSPQQQPLQQHSMYDIRQSIVSSSTPQTVTTGTPTIQSLFGKSSATPMAALSTVKAATTAVSPNAATTVHTTITTSKPATTIALLATTATPTSVFGTSSMFGGLSAPVSPTTAFNLSTNQATTAPPAATTSTISFGGLSSTAPSTPSFVGVLGATASLSFGTPTTGTSITPAFSKSSAPPASNIFGSTSPAATTAVITASTGSPVASSIFGKADGGDAAAVVSSTAPSPFGGGVVSSTTPAAVASTTVNTTTTTTSSSVFSGIGASTTSIFGGQTAATSSSPNSFFSPKPAATTAAAPTTSIFGGSATSTPNAGIFGSSGTSAPVFAASATTQPSNVFGASTTQNSGTSLFGGSSTTSPVFGGASATLANPVFGATAAATTATTTASTSVFGGATSTGNSSIFGGGAGATSSVFGASATPTASIFGSPPATATTTATSIFGTSSATTTPSMFGAGAGATTTATTPPSGSIFGAGPASPQAATGSVFGAATTSPGAGTGSIFGAPPALGGGTSMFGGATSPGGAMGSSMFGQPSAFGAKPVFGSPATDFGAAKTGFSSGFGSPPAFGAAPTAGFGNPSLLGAGSPLGGTSPSKVFGSSTFEALGAQSGGLSFGSLAQKTPEPEKPQSFQGSSSFSSWR